MAQRPTFLSIICILLALYGLASLAVGAMFVFVDFNIALLDELGDLLAYAGWSAIALGLITLIMVIFLWKGSKIGWFLVILFLIINLITGILAFPAGLILLLIVIFFLWYFFKPNVRKFFGI
jgi:hypothetical protein